MKLNYFRHVEDKFSLKLKYDNDCNHQIINQEMIAQWNRVNGRESKSNEPDLVEENIELKPWSGTISNPRLAIYHTQV